MKRISTTFLFAFLLLRCTAQNEKGIKSITERENGAIRKTQFYDTAGRITYWKEDMGVIMMASYYYENNLNVRTIMAHANVGYTIWENRFDSSGNEVEVFAFKEIPDTSQRFEPYK